MSSEEWLKNIDTESDTHVVQEKLRERIKFYQDENAKMDSIFEKLKLLMPENAQLLSVLDGATEVDEISKEACILSQQEKLRRHNYYASKIKLCIKMYTDLNEKLAMDIKTIKIEIGRSKSCLSNNNVSSKDDLKSLEAKVKRYENEMIKLEKKYPWLKDPQYNLPHIGEQIEKLNNLRNTKEKLIKDLAMYDGLKPNIAEANQQLKEAECEYKKIMKDIGEL